jgi:hypothetical protein
MVEKYPYSWLQDIAKITTVIAPTIAAKCSRNAFMLYFSGTSFGLALLATV